MEVPNNRVMDVLGSCAVEANVVRGPPGTEIFAELRELSHQDGDAVVVRVPAGRPQWGSGITWIDKDSRTGSSDVGMQVRNSRRRRLPVQREDEGRAVGRLT